MSDLTLEERKKHALKWVNARRKECGAKATSRLPKGYKRDGRLCPIAKALACVGVWHVCRDEDDNVQLWERFDGRVMTGSRVLYFKEPEVWTFIRDFDQGLYPELVIPPTPIKIKKPGERKATVIS